MAIRDRDLTKDEWVEVAQEAYKNYRLILMNKDPKPPKWEELPVEQHIAWATAVRIASVHTEKIVNEKKARKR